MTDLPWLGINRVFVSLAQPAGLSASDVRVTSTSGIGYGPVTIEAPGAAYMITLAQPINGPDRVTLSIGNALIADFSGRLDVLPGDVNDDGLVNVQDMVAVRNQMLGLLGALPPSSATSTAMARWTSTTTPRCGSWWWRTGEEF